MTLDKEQTINKDNLCEKTTKYSRINFIYAYVWHRKCTRNQLYLGSYNIFLRIIVRRIELFYLLILMSFFASMTTLQEIVVRHYSPLIFFLKARVIFGNCWFPFLKVPVIIHKICKVKLQKRKKNARFLLLILIFRKIISIFYKKLREINYPKHIACVFGKDTSSE